jgi:hypothetical protein
MTKYTFFADVSKLQIHEVQKIQYFYGTVPFQVKNRLKDQIKIGI